jgi:hypothetical protein
MSKIERLFAYLIIAILLVFIAFSREKTTVPKTITGPFLNSTTPSYRDSYAQKEKWYSLDEQISLPVPWPGEKIKTDLPYSIVDGEISDDVPAHIMIRYTVVISKNDALDSGQEGVKKLLRDLFLKTSDWVDKNYSKEKWRRICIFVKIPGIYGCIAILDKDDYPPDSPPRIDFSFWKNFEQLK